MSRHAYALENDLHPSISMPRATRPGYVTPPVLGVWPHAGNGFR